MQKIENTKYSLHQGINLSNNSHVWSPVVTRLIRRSRLHCLLIEIVIYNNILFSMYIFDFYYEVEIIN